MFKNLQRKKLLVVGDIMLDTYFEGDVKRISPEAPVPVFAKKGERAVLGGAANVAVNLVAAGQEVTVMAIIGDDDPGKDIKRLFDNFGIKTDFLFTQDRHTTQKTRLLASNNQQLLRVDIEDTFPLPSHECEEMLTLLSNRIKEYDTVIISDYMKGMLTYDLTQSIIKMANDNKIPTIVDVKDTDYSKYYGATLLKPNLKELCILTGREAISETEIAATSESLRDMCGCKYVLTTCGAQGMVLVGDDKPFYVKAQGLEVYDVTGAGDTVAAYVAACISNDYSIRDAVRIANLAGGIQVSKVGTSAVHWAEVRERLLRTEKGTTHKLLDCETLASFRKNHINEKIVFTNGCFDILHVGHIKYLQEAARLGDILVIGLNTDNSVKNLKGPDRPVNNENDRAEMLASFGFVDYVVLFDEDTPLELIKRLMPDVLVKGGDYAGIPVVGADEVISNGGTVKLIPYVQGKSTTNIIKKIRE